MFMLKIFNRHGTERLLIFSKINKLNLIESRNKILTEKNSKEGKGRDFQKQFANKSWKRLRTGKQHL